MTGQINEYSQCGGKGYNACHLGRFEDAQNQLGVIAPQIFQTEAGCGVEHYVEGEGLTLGMRKCPVEE